MKPTVTLGVMAKNYMYDFRLLMSTLSRKLLSYPEGTNKIDLERLARLFELWCRLIELICAYY